MFCKNCGKEINDNAVICPHCGVLLRDDGFPRPKQETNILALVGFILSFFFAVPGLVCSILGYRKAKELGGAGHNFAVAGIVISAVELGLAVLGILTYLGLFALLFGIGTMGAM